MKNRPGRVDWVTQDCFGLADGRVIKHPFILSEIPNQREMQSIYDHCWQAIEEDLEREEKNKRSGKHGFLRNGLLIDHENQL